MVAASRNIANGILRAVLVLSAVGLLLYFLYRIETVLTYLIIALVLTLIGNPIVDFLKRRLKFNHLFATIATLLFFVCIIFGFIMLFIPMLVHEAQNLSLLNTAEIEHSIHKLFAKITQFLSQHNIDSQMMLKQTNIASKINFAFLPDFFNVLLNTIGDFGIGLASTLFITFFFLKDRVRIADGASKLIPATHKVKTLNSVRKINSLLSRYFIGLLMQLSILFVMYLIVLLIFGIENAFVIAFLCALLNIVPYIGPLVAAILAGVLTMLSNIGADFQSEILPTTLYVMIGCIIVHAIDNNISVPIIFSKSVSSHPLEIFLVIVMSGFLFGVVGMVVAVPSLTMLKVISKEFFPENVVVKLFTKKI